MELSKRPKRLDVLDAAVAAVQNREGVYGSPQYHFDEVAKMWSLLLGKKLANEISAADVAMMMAGLKLVRLVNTPDHKDSQVDLAGYASMLREVV